MSNTDADTAAAHRAALRDEVPTALAQAQAASRRYQALSACLQYPDEELREALAAGALDEVLGAALRPCSDVEELQIEYTRLFDSVGASGPLCSLNAGDYAGNKLRVVEELLRFYDHFGLVPPEQYRVMPDHLTAQLEFVHFLAHAEAQTLAQGEDPAAYRRAQRDFLRREIQFWLPRLIQKLTEHRAADVFQALAASLHHTVEDELRRLDGVLAMSTR